MNDIDDIRNPFEIPDTYRVEKSQGVGKKEAAGQGDLGLE